MEQIYCNLDATGLNNGSDWENAFTSLDSAIAYANANGDSMIFIDGNNYTMVLNTVLVNIEIIGGNNPFRKINSPSYTSIRVINEIIIAAGITLIINNTELTYNSAIDMFSLVATAALTLNNCSCYSTVFIRNNGTVKLNDTFVITLSEGIISTDGFIGLSSSIIKNNNIALDLLNTDVTIQHSKLIAFHCILEDSAGIPVNITIDNSLLKGENVGINSMSAVAIYSINNTTIDGLSSVIMTNGLNVDISDSIILGTNNIGNNIATITNTAFDHFPVNYSIGDNIQLTIPLTFKKPSQYDYTPLFGVGETLKLFELTTANKLYVQNVQAQNFKDIPAKLTNFKYLVNNIFVLSDYMKEYEFADVMSLYRFDKLIHYVTYKKEYVDHNIPVVSAFPYANISGTDIVTWPYEWDYINYDDKEVYGAKDYIVPRSIIDITEIINTEYLFSPDVVSLANLQVLTFKEVIVNGIGYDYPNSAPSKIQVWCLNMDSQLECKNLYNNTMIESYNLLSKPLPNEQHYFIKPSGLIPYGEIENGYKYTAEKDPTMFLTGVNDQFDFEWLPTDRGLDFSTHGLVVYKDYILITGRYTIEDTNAILVYPTRGVYNEYITNTPDFYRIHNDDQVFTDLTVLEDGSLLLASINNTMLYRYVPRYDYAKIDGTNTTDTTLLLRENYSNVTLSGTI